MFSRIISVLSMGIECIYVPDGYSMEMTDRINTVNAAPVLFYRHDDSIRRLTSALTVLTSTHTLRSACRAETDPQHNVLSHEVFSQSVKMTSKL